MSLRLPHTPGPWERGIQHGEIVLAPKQKPRRLIICRVEWPHDSLIQAANANLIAAAPDLLAALKALYDAAEGRYNVGAEGVDPDGEQMTIARSVIAKAEGSA